MRGPGFMRVQRWRARAAAVATLLLAAAVVGAGAAVAAGEAAEALHRIEPRPARLDASATQALLLGAAWAGDRAVAVGERGTVLLTDARAAEVAPARSVPVDATLTAVHFVDAQRGWAVGHWGAILVTTDGGQTWAVQRMDLEQDRPLFAVHFSDAMHGVAVGLWSLVLVTDDGGRHWREVAIEAAPGARRADLNLLALFADRDGRLYATAEQGKLLRSDDRGQTWSYLDTGYRGSLWSGAVMRDGSLLVGGQRGSLWRSADGGASWQAVDSGGKGSITAIAVQGDEVAAVGLDGHVAYSGDGGRSFSAAPRDDRLTLTAALPAGAGRWLFGSRAGWVAATR